MKHGPQQLLLLGTGPAHVHVLAMLAAQAIPGVQITLVGSHPHHMVFGMLPGFVTDYYTVDECVIPLQPLIERAGVRWLHNSVRGVDARSQTVQLNDGSKLHFDWLSVDVDATLNRDQIERDLPGAREQALFVRPSEVFTALWPKLAEMGSKQALRIAVVGDGGDGIALALAVRSRFPSAAVTLLCGPKPLAADYPPKVQQRVRSVCRLRQVTVLQDQAVRFKTGAVLLGCGAELACDVPLLAVEPQPPHWLQESGLSLNGGGFLRVDASQRSTSHSRVFGTGMGSAREGHAQVRADLDPMHTGPVLAYNLAAVIAGHALKIHAPPRATLKLLSCGDRYAIASWGRFSAQGRWVWWLKNWIDRRIVARYRT